MPSLAGICFAAAAVLIACEACILCHPRLRANTIRGPLSPLTSAVFRSQLRYRHAQQLLGEPLLLGNSDHDEGALGKLKQLMLSSIRWYRREISPLMPPNCRFFPSCSNYALQAIEEFGAIKGGVLTAWRIMRCNPTGGYGYDPPQWPPPGYFAGTGGKRKK